jgi:hypothetical protein
MAKKSRLNVIDETWTARAFGPTSHGARGIMYSQQTARLGRVRTSRVWIQDDLLTSNLRDRFVRIVKIADAVNTEIESILCEHLAAKKGKKRCRRSTK